MTALIVVFAVTFVICGALSTWREYRLQKELRRVVGEAVIMHDVFVPPRVEGHKAFPTIYKHYLNSNYEHIDPMEILKRMKQ